MGKKTTTIALEAFGPEKYSSVYGIGGGAAFSLLSNDSESWYKSVGKAVLYGATRGGISLPYPKQLKR